MKESLHPNLVFRLHLQTSVQQEMTMLYMGLPNYMLTSLIDKFREYPAGVISRELICVGHLVEKKSFWSQRSIQVVLHQDRAF